MRVAQRVQHLNMHLLEIPPELLVLVLLRFPVRDVVAFRRTCRAANDVITGSIDLQYKLVSELNLE